MRFVCSRCTDLVLRSDCGGLNRRGVHFDRDTTENQANGSEIRFVNSDSGDGMTELLLRRDI